MLIYGKLFWNSLRVNVRKIVHTQQVPFDSSVIITHFPPNFQPYGGGAAYYRFGDIFD